MTSPPLSHPLVQRLLDHADDRAMLAALRRGLGQPPGAIPELFPYVAPFVQPRTEAACYLIAALFGLHPVNTASGNLGTHCRRLIALGAPPEPVARRFTHLLRSRREDLDDPLRQAISLLRSKDIAVNWQQLMSDMLLWSHPDRIAQRRWATQFWAGDDLTASSPASAQS